MNRPIFLVSAVVAAFTLATPALTQEGFADARAAMIDTIKEHARLAPGAVPMQLGDFTALGLTCERALIQVTPSLCWPILCCPGSSRRS